LFIAPVSLVGKIGGEELTDSTLLMQKMLQYCTVHPGTNAVRGRSA
jgi:hypothetical protein